MNQHGILYWTFHVRLVRVCFWFLFGIAVWRSISRRRFKRDEETAGFGLRQVSSRVQAMLHKCPPCLAGLLQWYGLFFLGFCVLMVFTYQANISIIWAHWKTTDLPIVVRWVSKASLVAGVVGFLFLSAHFVYAALKGRDWRASLGQPYPWAPSTRQDMVFCVLSVPAVYIAMSVQSTARMWMVIEKEYGPYGKDIDLGLYRQNLVLADACQYYVVWVFTQLCWRFIRERTSDPEIRFITKFAGFQGVHAFVLVGMVQCLLEGCMAYAEARAARQDHKRSTLYWQEFMDQHGEVMKSTCSKVADVLSAMTVLCVYNMFIIGRFESITHALGNANAKFLGTRMLLMLQSFQPKVLKVSAVHDALKLDENTSKLLHSSLLTLECLLVILFNFFSWEFGARKDLLYDSRSHHERKEQDGYQRMDNQA